MNPPRSCGVFQFRLIILSPTSPTLSLLTKERTKATIIDVAITNDHNLARKRLDKLRVYQVIMKPYEGDYSPIDNWCNGDILQSFQN